MKINSQNLKGTTDYYGKDQLIRNKITDILKETFIKYNYQPLDSTVLYNYDILAYKYKEGAEILSEMYTLTDQGNRRLGLRYDLTIPFCKFIANQKELRLPLKRYEIGKVFRNGPVKTGRCREFYQCDVDVVGISGQIIEAEQMQMVVDVFTKLGIDINIKWNNRKLMSIIIEDSNISKDKIEEVIGIIDKIEKISKQDFIKELSKIEIEEETANKLLDNFNKQLTDYIEMYEEDERIIAKEAIQEIKTLSSYIKKLNLLNNTTFTPTLARGLSIYTSTVFEFFDKKERLTCSLGGGGRYDKIITDFIDDGNIYPAVGLSFGLEPIYTIIKDEMATDSLIDVYIIPMDTEIESLMLARNLRQKNINVIVEMNNRKLKKCFEYASKENIKYVIVVGSNEIQENIYTIKDMTTSEQLKLPYNELEEYLLANKNQG
jgi:histidyl-tRNA synthetase